MRGADVAAERAAIDTQVNGQTLCTILERNAGVHGDLPAVHLGATPVSLYNTLAPEQIAYVAEHCQAKVAVVEGREFMERWEKVKTELPSLRHVVLLEDAGDFADYPW